MRKKSIRKNKTNRKKTYRKKTNRKEKYHKKTNRKKKSRRRNIQRGGMDFDDPEMAEALLEEMEEKEEQLRLAAEFGQTLLQRTEELQVENEAMEREKEAAVAEAEEHGYRARELQDNLDRLAEEAASKDAALDEARAEVERKEAEVEVREAEVNGKLEEIGSFEEVRRDGYNDGFAAGKNKTRDLRVKDAEMAAAQKAADEALKACNDQRGVIIAEQKDERAANKKALLESRGKVEEVGNINVRLGDKLKEKERSIKMLEQKNLNVTTNLQRRLEKSEDCLNKTRDVLMDNESKDHERLFRDYEAKSAKFDEVAAATEEAIDGLDDDLDDLE